MTYPAFAQRRNMAHREAETWRPPPFAPPATGIGAWLAALRRYFDLQAGSIWNDLSAVLREAQGTVLDVGCGAQPYRPLVNPRARYIGIDSADAKVHFGYEMPDTRYFTGDAWPVEPESIDMVLCTETLEHVRDSRLFLGEARRCLRPGGTLLLTVPFAARWHFIPFDYWRFTPSGLKLLLMESGFREIQVYARGNAVTVACYKLMALELQALMPQTGSPLRKLLFRFAGVLCLPKFVVVAVIANLSLRGRGGDDCLGYTALATKGSA